MPYAPSFQRPPTGLVERRRAVVVGVDHYRDASLDLGFCASSAARVGELLAARGYDVATLHDGPGSPAPPTVDGVRRAVERVTADARASDLLVLYVCSHGRRIARRPYLVLADTPPGLAGVRAGGLLLADLLDLLRCDARWVGVFLDVCQMGFGIDPTVGRSVAHGDEGDGGFALLAGSTRVEHARDPTSAGVFSRYLIEGLAGAAADPDGSVRASGLARHVQEGVARWRAEAGADGSRARQPPLVRLEVADLPLFKVRSYVELTPRSPKAITCAAFSYDGSRLITGGEDGAVRTWDPFRGGQVRASWHAAAVTAVASTTWDAFSTGATDGTAEIWSVETPGAYETAHVGLHVPIRALAWLPDTGRVIAAADGLYVQTEPDVIAAMADPWRIGDLRAVGVLPGGLVTGGADGRVCQWSNKKRGRLIGTHEGPVLALGVSPDGARVATAGGDPGPEHVQVWEVATRRALSLAHDAAVAAIAYAPDGSGLATAAADGKARVFDDTAAPRELAIEGEGGAPPPAATALCWSPDACRLFVGYADGRGRIFEISPGPR